MAEYASKGLSGTALGLGIAGTVALANQLVGCNGNGGILGNVLGGCGNARMGAELQYVSQLQAENAMLKSENYADKVGKEVFNQTIANDKEIRNELYAFIKPLAEEAANNRVELARVQEQLKCCCEKQELREQIVLGKVNEVAIATNGQFNAINNTISCIQNTLNSIVKPVVPNSSVCPGWGNVTITPSTTTPATSASL